MMTEHYRTGTDRVAGVARTFAGDYFVDLQGDEIPLHPGFITRSNRAVSTKATRHGHLETRIDSDQDLHNPGVVKVDDRSDGNALYFSRAPIPLVRDDPATNAVAGLHYIHLGLYIYTARTLLQIAGLAHRGLEDAEKLEQLRALEHGIPIRVWETNHPSLRVDSAGRRGPTLATDSKPRADAAVPQPS